MCALSIPPSLPPSGTFSQLLPRSPKGLFMLRQCPPPAARELKQHLLGFVVWAASEFFQQLVIFVSFPVGLFSIFPSLARSFSLIFPPFQLNFLINIFPHPSLSTRQEAVSQSVQFRKRGGSSFPPFSFSPLPPRFSRSVGGTTWFARSIVRPFNLGFFHFLGTKSQSDARSEKSAS